METDARRKEEKRDKDRRSVYKNHRRRENLVVRDSQLGPSFRREGIDGWKSIALGPHDP